jgi:hypothetical protein
MAEVQTEYNRYQPVGQVGQAASMTGWDADTKICETEAGIGFGLAVSQGVHDGWAVLGGTAFLGITKADQTLPASQSDKYAVGDNMAVHALGDIWVSPAHDVVPGDLVSYNTTTGRVGKLGSDVTIAGARWMTSAAADGLAVLRLGQLAGNATTV